MAMKKAAAQKSPKGSGFHKRDIPPLSDKETSLDDEPSSSARLALNLSDAQMDPSARVKQVANRGIALAAPGEQRAADLPTEPEKYVEEGFYSYDVVMALADGTLDEARMKRLKDGFFLLYDLL